MGREAECTVRWGKQTSTGKALLETKELIFRGDFGLKLAFDEIRSVKAQKGELRVRTAQGEAVFVLGAEAETWANKIKSPPTRLDKLGVKAGMQIALIGKMEPGFVAELRTRTDAISEAEQGSKHGQDLIFFAVEKKADLSRLAAIQQNLQPAGAIWVLRHKGPSASVTESEVMAAGKSSGLVDTKVVAFSPTHTAERLVIPVNLRKT